MDILAKNDNTSRFSVHKDKNPSFLNYDAWVVVEDGRGKKLSFKNSASILAAVGGQSLKHLEAKWKRLGKQGDIFQAELAPGKSLVILWGRKKLASFKALTTARQALEAVYAAKPSRVLFQLDKDLHPLTWLDALSSAWIARDFKGPSYKKSTKKSSVQNTAIDIFMPQADTKALERFLGERLHIAHETNFVRHLALLPGNKKHPSVYIQHVKKLAEIDRLNFRHYSLDQLEKMGAGAFCAVAQGSADRGGGIVRLAYEPKDKGDKSRLKNLVLVGKGVVFDTGGHNVKTSHMFGMHGDMTGSALAFSAVRLAQRNAWPFKVTAYLAITDNAIGPVAYRPNDHVTTLSGKSVEIVDTDAEGRLLLADTLALASQEKDVDIMVDFATLTGSCMRALGTAYSGVFSNRMKLIHLAVKAGTVSGERVWGFPLSHDFGKILESSVADLKQCRQGGGPDHIEAAWFLKQFVGKGIPWLHVDLSAAENDGGLAHVPDKVTGFGMRWLAAFVELLEESGVLPMPIGRNGHGKSPRKKGK